MYVVGGIGSHSWCHHHTRVYLLDSRPVVLRDMRGFMAACRLANTLGNTSSCAASNCFIL